MRILMSFILFATTVVSAAEFGWLDDYEVGNAVREIYSNDGNIVSSTLFNFYTSIRDVELAAGDSISFLSTSGGSAIYVYRATSDRTSADIYGWPSSDLRGKEMIIVLKYNGVYVPLEARTLHGPLTITGVKGDGYAVQYRIDRASDVQPEIKYSAALNSDGNRLAIAQQDGTNSFTRVYEFDGSSWNQLGADVQ